MALDRGLDGRIVIVDKSSAPVREILPPQPGPVARLRASGDGSVLFFRHGSFLRRQPVRWVHLETGEEGLFSPVGPGLEPVEYEVRRIEYPSHDGTLVPLFVAHRRPLPLDGRNATVLYAYGAWGWSPGPWYHQRWASWLEAGGVVAIANVRGGGEYGRAWHDAGKKGARGNAVADVHDAARWLMDHGYTSREHLGVLGLSAGVPTVASALLRRPELFGAAVLEVGLLDLVRFGVAREFGDPGKPGEDEAAAALAFSPYNEVGEEGVCLPPVLVVTSEDDRLFPQALKLTARAQAVQRCAGPVLLHVGETEGHLPTGRVGARRHLHELLFLSRALTPTDDRPTGP